MTQQDEPQQDPVDRKALWLAERRKAITATDAAKIMGLSKFGGPMSVFLDKRGETAVVENDAMRWGRRFERPILEEYADRTQQPLVFADPFQMIRAGRAFPDRNPIIGATLDAVRERDGRPVDAKNVGFRTEEYGESGTDQMPLYYGVQLMLQMYVTGQQLADLAVLFSRSDFRIYTLEYDAATAEGIVERCDEFWRNHILTGKPPEVDGSPEYSTFLARTLRQRTDLVVKATPDIDKAALYLNTTSQQMEELDALHTQQQNIIKAAIGEAKAIEGAGWRATWTQSKDSNMVDWKGVAEAVAAASGLTLDEYIKQHTEVRAGSRRFTFNMKQES